MKRRALRRRYGRAHPLLPRLVVYLNKISPTDVVLSAKLQSRYTGPWKTVEKTAFHSVPAARMAMHDLASEWAFRHGVPSSHVEWA